MCVLWGRAPEGGRDTNGKQTGTGGALVWLELNKIIKRAQFARGVGRTEIPAVLEGQGRITQFAAKLPPGREGSRAHDQRHLLPSAHTQAAPTLFNKGADQRTITIIVRKMICFLWPPRGVMSDKTPQFISKEFVANAEKLNELNC